MLNKHSNNELGIKIVSSLLKLILHSCDPQKVHVFLQVTDRLLNLLLAVLHALICSIEEILEFEVVLLLQDLLGNHKRPETFASEIFAFLVDEAS